MGLGTHKASWILAAIESGKEVPVPPGIAARCPDGYVPVGWYRAWNVKSNPKRLFDGPASTIRTRALRAGRDVSASHWLMTMAILFYVVFVLDGEIAKGVVRILSDGIGETQFAINYLWPMIDKKHQT